MGRQKRGDGASDAVVVEADGMLWKPRPGARISAEVFLAARRFYFGTLEAAEWNPWLREERAADSSRNGQAPRR